MENIIKHVSFFAIVFLLETLFINLKGLKVHLPGDIDIDKPGIKIYLPVVSAVVLTAVLTYLLNFFR